MIDFIEENDRLDRAFLSGNVRGVVSDMAEQTRRELYASLEKETHEELGEYSPRA